MRPSVLDYNYWDNCTLANSFFGRSGNDYGTRFSWFAFTPKMVYCTIPSKPFSSTVTLAVGAVATFTIPNAVSVTSSNPSFATATISGGIVTITGVATGTTTVSVRDVMGNPVASIVVTIS